MNKLFVVISTLVVGLAGSFFPYLIDEGDLFRGWSIICGIIGGLFGLWIGITIAQGLRKND